MGGANSSAGFAVKAVAQSLFRNVSQKPLEML